MRGAGAASSHPLRRRAALDNQWRLEQTLTQQSLVLKNAKKKKKKKKFGLRQRDNKEF